MLLKHLPREALEKSSQGSFSNRRQESRVPVARPPGRAQHRRRAAEFPTGPHAVDPRAIRLRGKAGSRKGQQEGRRPAAGSAGGRGVTLYQVTFIYEASLCMCLPSWGGMPCSWRVSTRPSLHSVFFIIPTRNKKQA